MPNKNPNNSDILHLETLIKQYDTTLIQYTQVQNDYVNYLQLSSTAPQSRMNNSNLVKVKGSTFWGSSAISSSNVSSVEQCSALCSRTPGCSGATFNKTATSQNNCFLRSGDGEVIAGTTNQYAIISKGKEYLLTLQNLNNQLIQINNQIVSFIEANDTTFTSQNAEILSQYNLLKKNYSALAIERKNILRRLAQYQSLDEIQTQSELIVNKNYYTYVLLIFIVLICVFFTGKIFIDTSNTASSENNINVFLLIFVIFVISFIILWIILYFQKRQINIF
jgi:hypothetical protein